MRFSTRLPSPIEPIKATRIDVSAKLVGLADHRFSRAKHQPAVFGHRARRAGRTPRFLLRAEIEKDVAAQDDVEPAGMRGRSSMLWTWKRKVLAKRLDRAPAVGHLLEPFDHLVDSEPALDLELAVGAGPCAIDAGGRNVGTEDIDRPAAPLFGSSANSIASE